MSDRLNVQDDVPYSKLGSQPHGPQHPPPTPYRFTPEELRVMRECSRDAFYKRSLPFATFLSILTYGAVKQGYISGHTRWGPTPKVLIAAFVGYFVGKMSYQRVCAERIMRLPNSPIGEALRRRKYGRSGESLTLDPGAVLSPFGSYPSVDSDITPTYDLDSDRPHIKGLDEFSRPSYDSNILEEEEELPAGNPLHSTTYEELRRKNRDEYEQQKRSRPQYRGPISDDVPPRPLPARPTPEYPNYDKPRNIYGDVWEK